MFFKMFNGTWIRIIFRVTFEARHLLTDPRLLFTIHRSRIPSTPPRCAHIPPPVPYRHFFVWFWFEIESPVSMDLILFLPSFCTRLVAWASQMQHHRLLFCFAFYWSEVWLLFLGFLLIVFDFFFNPFSFFPELTISSEFSFPYIGEFGIPYVIRFLSTYKIPNTPDNPIIWQIQTSFS